MPAVYHNNHNEGPFSAYACLTSSYSSAALTAVFQKHFNLWIAAAENPLLITNVEESETQTETLHGGKEEGPLRLFTCAAVTSESVSVHAGSGRRGISQTAADSCVLL